MKGDRVIVRCHGGEAQTCRVWETSDQAIAVYPESVYEQVQAGSPAPPPVGVPANDVFEYDSKWDTEAVGPIPGAKDWAALKPWSGSRSGSDIETTREEWSA